MARKPKATKAIAAPAAKAAAQDAATVTVQCLIPGGLVLRCFTMHADGDGADPRAIATGMTTLVYGSNPDIDAAFMAAWLNQNADLDAVQSGLVSVLTEGNS